MGDIADQYRDLDLSKTEAQASAEGWFADRHPHSPMPVLQSHDRAKVRIRDRLLWPHWPHWPQEALSLILLAMTITQLPVVFRLWRPPSVPRLLGEINGLVPEFSAKLVQFTSTKLEGTNALNSSHPSWTNIMPEGGGFIKVAANLWEPHAAQLPPPMRFEGHDAFSVAIFHQLHCLHYLLVEFNKLVEKSGGGGIAVKSRTSSQKKHEHELGSEEAEALHHVGHCFDYLRSSLICCGDTALEGQASDTTEPGTLGERSHHVCKDYRRIKEWAELNRVSNQKGFGNE